MKFAYRYVGYGTNFELPTGKPYRGPDDTDEPPGLLYPNEVAVDVGAACLEYQNEKRHVFDHHFYRDAQVPAAAAAVLHHAEALQADFRGRDYPVVWLVTHIDPDFDAYASMYIVRWLLEDPDAAREWSSFGFNPEGWKDGLDRVGKPVPRFKWFTPDVSPLPKPVRWAVLLASYAAVVDNAKRIACPRNRALHSVLYAANYRGRRAELLTSGAREFFDEARRGIETGLHPLYDSVLKEDGAFSPEFSLLDRELEIYARDLRRARRAIVMVPTVEKFDDAYKAVIEKPLLDGNRAITSDHRNFGRGDAPTTPAVATELVQTDGLYLRDPECLLFKEWVRLDTENSSMHEGFTFTCIAYSDNRPHGTVNTNDYYLSLDPDTARGRHLYNLWANVQQAEIEALCNPKGEDKRKGDICALRHEFEVKESDAQAHGRTRCRKGYEGRAGVYKALFDDPWFDGENYRCTIIATPNRGTLIGEPQSRSDLSDDPIAQIVRRELEFSILTPPVTITDCAAKPGMNDKKALAVEVDGHIRGVTGVYLTAPEEGFFRFGSVELVKSADLYHDALALQIGGMLWGYLHPEEKEHPPPDLLQRRLFRQGDLLGVWSRRGVAVAYKPAAQKKARELAKLFGDLIDVARKVAKIVDDASGFDAEKSTNDQPGHDEAQKVRDIVHSSEQQMSSIARLRHKLSMPEGRLVGLFVEEIELNRVLETLRDVYQAKKLDEQGERIGYHAGVVAEVQSKVEWLEIFFVAFYSTELGDIVARHLFQDSESLQLPLIMLITIMITVLTARYVKPWKRDPSARGLAILGLIGLLVVLVVASIQPVCELLSSSSSQSNSASQTGAATVHTPANPSSKKPGS